MRPSLPRLALVASLALATACGGAEEELPEGELEPVEERAVPETSSFGVEILEPADGAELDGPDLTVRMEATGVQIVPAGEIQEGTGHHHIYLDHDLGEPGAPVPTVPGAVIHLGDGSAEYTFEDVAPGEHRIIAVVADGLHVPIQPWVVDTVTVTVR